MSTLFPTSIQDLDATRGSASDTLASVDHATHHRTEDDTIEALQAKVGVDNSAVTSSLDYKLTNTSSINPGHLHTLDNLSDVSTSGAVNGDFLSYNGSSWAPTTTSAPDASTTVKGVAKMSVAPASAASPIAVGDNDGRVPTQDENDALVGTSGTPSSSNKYVTNDDTSASGATSSVMRQSQTTLTTMRTFTTGENITSGDAVRIIPTSHEVTFGSDSTTEREMNNVASSFTTKLGLKFTIGSTTLLVNQLKFYIKKTGSPGTLTVKLGTAIDTSDVISTTVAEGSISTSKTEITVTLPSIVKLTALTEYYITWQPATTDSSNYYGIYGEATGGGAGTNWWIYSSAAWASYNQPSNVAFKYGLSDGTAGQIKKAKATTTGETQLFLGFANATATSGNSVNVTVSGVGFNQTGLSVGGLYYLSDTAGAISTSAGTVSKKVGMPISTTELLIKNENA